jgi:hypothetical protein
MSLSKNLIREIGGLEVTYFINNNNSRISNLGTPVNPTDAATKQYVDSNITSSGFNAGTGIIITTGNLISISNSLTHVTALGNINTGTWSANTIAINYGGTGKSSFAPNKIIIGNGTNPLISVDSVSFESNSFVSKSHVLCSNTTDSIGVGSGGSLTVVGGTSISKSLSVGQNTTVQNDLVVLGNTTVANITITGISSFSQVSSTYSTFTNVTTNNCKIINNNTINLTAASAIITNNSVSNLYTDTATLGNMTNTNLYSLNQTSSNLNCLSATINSTIFQNITSANIYSTNSTSVNHFASNSTITNLTVSNSTFANIINSTLTSTSITSTNFNNNGSITTGNLLVRNNASLNNTTSANLFLSQGTLGNCLFNNVTTTNVSTSSHTCTNEIVSNITNSNLNTTNITTTNLMSTFNTLNNVVISGLSSSNLNVPGISIMGTMQSTNLSTGFIYTSNNIRSLNLSATNISSSSNLLTFIQNTSMTNNSLLSTNITSTNLIINNLAIFGTVQSNNLSTGSLTVNGSSNLNQLLVSNISTTTLRISDVCIANSINATSVSVGTIYTSNLLNTKNLIVNSATLGTQLCTGISTGILNVSSLAILSSVQSVSLSSGSISVSGLTQSPNIQSINNTVTNLTVTASTSSNSFIDNGCVIKKTLTLGSNFSGTPSASSGALLSILPLIFTDTNSTVNSINSMWSSNYLAAPTLAAQNTGITTNKASTIHISNKPSPGANQTINYSGALSIGYVSNQTGSYLTGQIMLERNDGNWYSSIYTEDATNRFVLANGSLSGGAGIGLYTYVDTPVVFAHIPASTNVTPTQFARFSRASSTFFSTQESSNGSTGSLIVSGGLGVGKTLCCNCLALSNVFAATPVDGDNVSIPDACSVAIIKASTTLTNLIVNFPLAPANGQILCISSLQSITNTSFGNTNLSPRSLNLNLPLRFVYYKNDSSWYPI